MKKNKTIKIIVIISIIVIVLIASTTIAFFSYVNDYYHHDETADVYLKTNNVTVTKEDGYYFFDGSGTRRAVIFYPGAKVEYTSYAPLMYRMAEAGIDSFLVEMPYNLAILKEDAAAPIRSKYKYEYWYLSGHSLGGVAASNYAIKHSNEFSGIFLFAAYPTKKINDRMLSLFIYGDSDGVLNKKKYEDSKKYWNEFSEEHIIKGGNHAYFGNYGEQKGDNKATISHDDQQNEAIDAIVAYLS